LFTNEIHFIFRFFLKGR